MVHPFDRSYSDEPFSSLVENYPGPSVYPPADFRVEWGPIFHRGRLDGSARVLILGQDPSHNEDIVRRILVGEAGRRTQGFLAKLGIDQSYVMINTFLYSVYGQSGGNSHRNDANIAAYRNLWLDALLVGQKVEAAVALGTLADSAWGQWKSTDNGKKFAGQYVKIIHPTQPESAAGGNAAKLAALTKAMLQNWNSALKVLKLAIQNPDRQVQLVPYGDSFKPAELVNIPELDFPPGLPDWMRNGDGWATRAGATPAATRANITITVPPDALPKATAGGKSRLKQSVVVTDYVAVSDYVDTPLSFPNPVVSQFIDPETGSKFALSGRVVCMDDKFTLLPRGTVYVQEGNIVAVKDAKAPPPKGFESVKALPTGGTIYPGLIELHNHLSYNALRLWQVPQLFSNRDQWSKTNAQYKDLVSGPMQVIGREPDVVPSLVRYVECKCLLAGVTTSQGIALSSNSGIRTYYEGVIRTVERPDDPGLPAAGTRIPDVSASDRDAFLTELKKKQCMLLHLSEGTDQAARNHFLALQDTAGNWAITPSLAGIHCVALKQSDFQILAQHGASMVWSPMSNPLLYSATADVKTAKAMGLRIAIGSDWSPSGSKNLLCELKVARIYSQNNGGLFTDQEIVAMATREAARILCWDKLIGSIEPGKRADLLVLKKPTGDSYSNLISATEADLDLVMIHGVPQYGSANMMKTLGADAGAESVKVGGRAQIVHLTSKDPHVPAVPLSDATQTVADALKRLPQLVQKAKLSLAREAEAGAAGVRRPEVWTLELDELQDTGFEQRPRLPMGSTLTGSAPPLELELPKTLGPLQLDPIVVVDDSDFVDRVQSESNLPRYIGSGLARLY